MANNKKKDARPWQQLPPTTEARWKLLNTGKAHLLPSAEEQGTLLSKSSNPCQPNPLASFAPVAFYYQQWQSDKEGGRRWHDWKKEARKKEDSEGKRGTGKEAVMVEEERRQELASFTLMPPSSASDTTLLSPYKLMLWSTGDRVRSTENLLVMESDVHHQRCSSKTPFCYSHRSTETQWQQLALGG